MNAFLMMKMKQLSFVNTISINSYAQKVVKAARITFLE